MRPGSGVLQARAARNPRDYAFMSIRSIGIRPTMFCSSAMVRQWLFVAGTAGVAFLMMAFTLCPARGLAQEDQPPEQSATIPDYETLIDTLRNGTKFERGPAAAWLCEYPERLDEFTEDVADLLITPDALLNRIAADLFQYYGKEAIPPALAMFEPAAVTTRAGDEKWRRVCGIIHALGEIGREPFEAKLIAVLQEYEDINVRVPAIYALTGLRGGSPEAIPLIIGDLNHENFNVGLPGLRLIANTGAAATPALETVRALFAEGDLSRRTYASMALGGIGPVDGYDPLDDLEAKLEKFYLVVRERSLVGIGLLGEHARRVEPKVVAMMNEDGSNLEALAAYVLWQITGDADQAVARLIELSERPEFEVAALEFLGKIGPAANESTSLLLLRMKTGDESVKAYAIEALSQICPDDDAFREKLDEYAEGDSAYLRLKAKLALRERARDANESRSRAQETGEGERK